MRTTTAFLAYFLGSYFIAGLLFTAGFRERELLAAPFLLPWWIGVMLLLTGDQNGVVWAIFLWCLAIIGFWGLLKSWREKTVPWWPFVLLLVLDAILFYAWIDS